MWLIFIAFKSDFELIKPSGDMWMVAALMAWDTSELQKGAANLTHKGAYVNQGRG